MEITLTRNINGYVEFIPKSQQLNDNNCDIGLKIMHRYPHFGSAVILGVDPVDKRLIQVRWDGSRAESDWMYRDDFYMLQTV